MKLSAIIITFIIIFVLIDPYIYLHNQYQNNHQYKSNHNYSPDFDFTYVAPISPLIPDTFVTQLPERTGLIASNIFSIASGTNLLGVELGYNYFPSDQNRASLDLLGVYEMYLVDNISVNFKAGVTYEMMQNNIDDIELSQTSTKMQPKLSVNILYEFK